MGDELSSGYLALLLRQRTGVKTDDDAWHRMLAWMPSRRESPGRGRGTVPPCARAASASRGDAACSTTVDPLPRAACVPSCTMRPVLAAALACERSVRDAGRRSAAADAGMSAAKSAARLCRLYATLLARFMPIELAGVTRPGWPPCGVGSHRRGGPAPAGAAAPARRPPGVICSCR